MIGLAQCLGAFFSELSCIAFLCTQDTTMLTLTKFIALAFISKVGMFYSAALPQNYRMKKPCSPLKIKVHAGDPETLNRTWYLKFFRFVYKFVRMSYVASFYYFFPYASILLTDLADKNSYSDF